MKRFVILTLCIITGTCINAQKKFKTTRQIQASSAKINGIYIPRDVNDAVNVLDTLLTNEQKDTLKTLSYEDYMAGLHHGLGMKLRNDWGLWKDSRLSLYFVSSGISHPDKMSDYILLAFYHHLHGTERPNIKDIKSSSNVSKVRMFLRRLSTRRGNKRAANADAIRKLSDDGFKKGAEVYYKYPYGFSTEKEENIYRTANNPEMKARGVIKKINKRRRLLLIEITHTPEPYGIIIFDGNQAWGEDSHKDYSKFSPETPSIFFIQEGEELWFSIYEINKYWHPL